MICISVTPQSRTLAKVDLINAARQCDLIELCLDHLIKEPDISDLVRCVSKPMVVSCRRTADGGHWSGTEAERVQLLRQAIVSAPAYVELELDIARSIPRFGQTKRVVAYTSIDRPLSKVDDVFEEVYKSNADVAKFTWPTPTLDAAWPLLAAVTQKRELPVVGLGLGKAGVTFSLLGRKYGSPWIYAALEKGMEAFEGQPTVVELDELYEWRTIDRHTRFVGVVGMGTPEEAVTRALNAGFRAIGSNMRCLPLALGKFDKLAQMLEVLKINALVVSPRLGSSVFEFAQQPEEAAATCLYADLLLKKGDAWHGYTALWRSTLLALEAALGKTGAEDRPLDRRNVLIIGHDGVARALAYGVRKRKGIVSIAGRDDKQARGAAEALGARHVPFGRLYDTLADVVAITDAALPLGHRKEEFNPGYFRPQMTVLDVTRLPEDTPVLTEARQRACRIVEPREIFADLMAAQFKAITGRELPAGAVA